MVRRYPDNMQDTCAVGSIEPARARAAQQCVAQRYMYSLCKPDRRCLGRPGEIGVCHSGILDPFCSFRGLGIIPVILSSFRPASRSCRIVHEAAGRRGSVAPWWQAMAGVHHHPVIWRRGSYRHRLWSQGVDQNGQNGSGCCCNGEMEVSSGCSWKSWEPPCGGGKWG